jgi:hypothetical protein
MQQEIIVGIPGHWKSRSEIVQSIASNSGGLIFAGTVMLDTRTNEAFPLHIYEHDPSLARAFQIAGQGRMPEQTIAQIGSHTFTLYCIVPSTSPDAAKKMLALISALLKCGGLAAKVETAGVAHTTERWELFNARGKPYDLYCAFVTLIGSQECFYSCGMHNFGLPDSYVDRSLQPTEAAGLLTEFNCYQLAESPKFNDGHTFSVGQNAPRFVLKKEECKFFPPNDYFFNPHGVWHLARK